jgi:hypothetical protein
MVKNSCPSLSPSGRVPSGYPILIPKLPSLRSSPGTVQLTKGMWWPPGSAPARLALVTGHLSDPGPSGEPRLGTTWHMAAPARDQG